MAVVKAFRGHRPTAALAEKVACKPYDVLNSKEARAEKGDNAYSFYRVNKPEVDLPEGTDLYSDIVYDTARKNLDELIGNGTLVQDELACMYVYRQIMPGSMIGLANDAEQYGLVAASSVQDYFDDVIKKHEYTRPVKEEDRIRHMDTLSAHVGPVFMTYPQVADIDAIVAEAAKGTPTYDFKADDGVQHTLWVISDADTTAQLENLFATQVPATYIADGHHRAASSAKVGKRRAEANPNHTGKENYNQFLSVLFPADQLTIIDYNRVVKDLNGLSEEAFLAKLAEKFEVEQQSSLFKPTQLHEFSLYMAGSWYKLTSKPGTWTEDPIGVLDVTVLTNNVLDPLLDIKDQRTSDRIDFVGGIRGLKELEKRVDSGEMKAAFALYAVTIQQLIDIADSGNVMPPKSTWFEPKLRSGLVINQFEDLK